MLQKKPKKFSASETKKTFTHTQGLCGRPSWKVFTNEWVKYRPEAHTSLKDSIRNMCFP